jgi:hypothetical protein
MSGARKSPTFKSQKMMNDRTEKNDYTTPELKVLGNVADVTELDYKFGGDDGVYGFVSYIYTPQTDAEFDQ